MNFDLTSLLQPADFSKVAVLTIDALAPLSMVTKMPGKYYRSQAAPTEEMLYGLLENALGWHISEKDRNEFIKRIQKKHTKTAQVSGVGFKSLLQFHLRFGIRIADNSETVLRYDDYWSQHLRTNGQEFVGGSREYDSRAIPVMNANAKEDKDPEKVRFGDRKALSKDKNLITDFRLGETLHYDVIRPFFPRYYVTPTPREYVVPSTAYQYRVETSSKIAEMIADALAHPAAPLYLGSNDGWVEVSWKSFPEINK